MDATVEQEGDEAVPVSTQSDYPEVNVYGWVAILVIGIIYFIYSKFPKRVITSNASCKKTDEDSMLRNHEQMHKNRALLQERFNVQAARIKEQNEEKERLKSQERIDEWNKLQKGEGYHSKHRVIPDTQEAKPTAVKKDTNKFKRNDYNPLTGDGAGAGPSRYRPSPRFSGGG